MGESNELNNSLNAKAVQDVIDERDRLRAEVAEWRRALEEARHELSDKAAITAERDQYLKSLHALFLKDFYITAEEIADMEKNRGISARSSRKSKPTFAREDYSMTTNGDGV
jgi:hypothetical protein